MLASFVDTQFQRGFNCFYHGDDVVFQKVCFSLNIPDYTFILVSCEGKKDVPLTLVWDLSITYAQVTILDPSNVPKQGFMISQL